MIFGHMGVKPRALSSMNKGVTVGHESYMRGSGFSLRIWVEEADG